jgi:FixJ family two-component response regulator
LKVSRALVSVVDDDESVRESLPDLLRDFGFDVQVFSSAEAFAESPTIREINCLILDVGLPGMSGPDLHKELLRQGHDIPTIFVTAQTDPALFSRLIDAGAVACLFKPFSDAALLDAITNALRTR